MLSPVRWAEGVHGTGHSNISWGSAMVTSIFSPGPFFDSGYEAHRLTVIADEAYDDVRRGYEQAVPAYDNAAFREQVARKADWSEVVELMDASAPYGFLRYWGSEITPLMSLAGTPTPCSSYLMGNHTIAARMFRHDPAVMVYVPIQLVITVDGAGRTVLVVDQPSRALASFGGPEIAEVGIELDHKLATLLRHLGIPVPPVLLGTT